MYHKSRSAYFKIAQSFSICMPTSNIFVKLNNSNLCYLHCNRKEEQTTDLKKARFFAAVCNLRFHQECPIVSRSEFTQKRLKQQITMV